MKPMAQLAGKQILVGITGGIAAYKSAELVRRLRDEGAEVRVAMTRSATAFVGPLTFQALSSHPVHVDLLDPGTESVMGHIELARWSDLILVAPATADFIARLAHGFADDLLTTLCLASSAPLLLAPAMNQQMWAADATQANCALLRNRGVRLAGPAEGSQACGETGPGRMLEPPALVDAVIAAFASGSLAGLRVLVTAGPTREAIDPVRYLSNRSSGRMGYAIARAAREAGAAVTLVSGPTVLPTPRGVERIDVESAEEMRAAVMGALKDIDIFIAAAAVADYRCRAPAREKLKKQAAELALTLERTPDILAEVAQRQPAPFTVGFAAETERVREHALAKLRSKKLDMIAANDVGQPGLGFDSEQNALSLYWHGGNLELPESGKEQLARQLIEVIANRYREKHKTEDSRPEAGYPLPAS